jgi:hypothetical protein
MHPLRTICPLARIGARGNSGGLDRGRLAAGVCDAVADAGDGLDRRGIAEFAAEPADGAAERIEFYPGRAQDPLAAFYEMVGGDDVHVEMAG